MEFVDLDIVTLTRCLYITCGVVWILSILRCLAYRHLANIVEKSRMQSCPDDELPAFTVIITSHNQSDCLKRHLPLIITQIYPNFEVLVVDMNSTDDSEKVLEQLEAEYPNLRHTFTPSTSRDISTQRLAITLGIKGASNPWIVLTQADCCPISHLWLRRLGESIKGHRSAEIALGYTRYKKAKGYTEQKMYFYRLWQQMKTLKYTPKHGIYRCDGTNMAYKKELFLSHQGFASHSNLLMGATDIMVNQQSTKDNSVVFVHPEAIVEQQMPGHKHWVQDRLYFQESRRHFKNTWFYRMRSAASIILHALLMLTLIASITVAILNEEYVIAGVAASLWVIHTIMQGLSFNTTAKALNDQGYSHLKIGWFIHLLPFWHLRVWLQYTFGNKKKYRKKYI